MGTLNRAGVFAAVASALATGANVVLDKASGLINNFGLGAGAPRATSPFCPQIDVTKTHVATESTGWCKANRSMLKRSKAKRAASKAKRGF